MTSSNKLFRLNKQKISCKRQILKYRNSINLPRKLWPLSRCIRIVWRLSMAHYNNKRLLNTINVYKTSLYFFYCNENLDSGLVIALYPLSSLLEISCRFQFHNLWRAWNGQHWLFHNLALFSIYGNDGTTISRRGVIINLKKYHWEKVQKGIPL